MEIKYNKWTVIDEVKIIRDNRVYLKCRCECGSEREIIIKNLKSGQSKSCGCIKKTQLQSRNYRHGKRGTRTYGIWLAMKTRCYNQKFHQYKDYGGRGIIMCEEWKNDFMAFYNHTGEIEKGLSIDRIDNNKGYEPGNVRLATQEEQCKNKRNNHKINGECVTHISKRLGGGPGLVRKRIERGWTIERAITEKTHAVI